MRDEPSPCATTTTPDGLGPVYYNHNNNKQHTKIWCDLMGWLPAAVKAAGADACATTSPPPPPINN